MNIETEAPLTATDQALYTKWYMTKIIHTIDKEAHEVLIMDVAIPNNSHMFETENDKTDNFQDLLVEIQRL